MKDFRGRDINVGDTIIYPGRSGAHMSVNQAVVLAIQEGQGQRYNWRIPLFESAEAEKAERAAQLPYIPALLTVQRQGGQRQSRIERIDRVAVVPA